MNILKTIVRIGIGVFFIASAILKLLSLDHFELYIYSFNIFSFILSSFAARAIIAAEILVGVLLIAKVRYKEAWWLTMLMLIGFSLLLVYVILFRDDSNCHCMGDLVEIKPSLSLIKNLVAIALMLFIRKEEDYRFKGRIAVLVGAFVAAIVPPFVLFPMDNFYNMFSKTNNLNYNETELNALMADSIMQGVSFDDGNYIVGVVSSGCEFCHTGCLKLSEIVDNNQLVTALQYANSGQKPNRSHSVSSIFLPFRPFMLSMVSSPHSCLCVTVKCRAPLTCAILQKKQ